MKALLVAFASGVVFALGLGVSGMTNPEKVLGFLDVRGVWDPSLALVMVGAIGVHAGGALWARRASRPLWASAFAFSRRTAIDPALVGGAVLFGLGWGAAGYCPGPAVVDLAAPSPSRIAFVASMVAGILLHRLASGLLRPSQIAVAARPSDPTANPEA
jgi:uncharacterized membrane protein YedE/YeeE